MLTGASARRIAAALHTKSATESLLAAVQETLIGLGRSGTYTLVFNSGEGCQARICGSTLDGLSPGDMLTMNPDALTPGLNGDAPVFFDTLRTVARGDSELQAGAIAPLRSDGETYGALLLHEVIPQAAHDLVEFLAEQLGFALPRVQLNEAFQHRHAIHAAKLSAIAETGHVLQELDLDVLLVKFMELALSTVSAEVGCIVLRETEEADLSCRVEWGLDSSALQKLRLKTGGTLAETVVHTNRPFIIRHMATEQPLLPDPILNGIDSLVAMPLTTNRHVLGCLIVINPSTPSRQDVDLLRTVAELSSIAIENAVLHQQALEKEALHEQLRIAGNIQRSLLPASAPAVKGMQLSAWNLPCDESGGDYYDFFQFDEHHVGFVVADATGHGIGAALMATSTRAFLRALIELTDDPVQVFERLNNLTQADFTEGKFITLFLGIYNTQDHTLTYVSAGHRPPLILYRRARKTFEYLKATGIPLGIVPDVAYAQQTVAPLEVGDIMLLLTDGVEETFSESGEHFGQDRLLSLLRTHDDADPLDLIERIHSATCDFRGPVPQKDDITILCLRVTAD